MMIMIMIMIVPLRFFLGFSTKIDSKKSIKALVKSLNNFSFNISSSSLFISGLSPRISVLSNNNNNRLLTIEIDPMYLIERDNNDKNYLEKIKYSSIKLLTNSEK